MRAASVCVIGLSVLVLDWSDIVSFDVAKYSSLVYNLMFENSNG